MAEASSPCKSSSSLEFNFETRYVVLNYFGHIPTTPSREGSSRFSLTQSANRSSLLSQQLSHGSSIDSNVAIDHHDAAALTSSSGSGGIASLSGSGAGVGSLSSSVANSGGIPLSSKLSLGQQEIPDAPPQVEITKDIVKQYHIVHSPRLPTESAQTTETEDVNVQTGSGDTLSVTDKPFLFPHEMRLKSGSFSSVSSDRTITGDRVVMRNSSNEGSDSAVKTPDEKLTTAKDILYDETTVCSTAEEEMDKLYLSKYPEMDKEQDAKISDTVSEKRLDESTNNSSATSNDSHSKAQCSSVEKRSVYMQSGGGLGRDRYLIRRSKGELSTSSGAKENRNSLESFSTVSISSLVNHYHHRPSTLSLKQISKDDVASLVKESSLPAVALPLKEELSREFTQLEKDVDSAVSSNSVRKESLSLDAPVVSPESVIAQRLGVLGDRIEARFGDTLSIAVNDVVAQNSDSVTYEMFKKIAETDGIINNSLTGWGKVALMLAFSRNITLALLQKGERGLGLIADHTVRLIEDHAAEFILKQGGWESISNLELSPESMSPVSGTAGPRFPDLSYDSSISDIHNPYYSSGAGVGLPYATYDTSTDTTNQHQPIVVQPTSNVGAIGTINETDESGDCNADATDNNNKFQRQVSANGNKPRRDVSIVNEEIAYIRQFSDANSISSNDADNTAWYTDISVLIPMVIVTATAVMWLSWKRLKGR